MWQMWSPEWNFSEAEFQTAAQSWNNPDFQKIINHSYRFAYKLTAGGPHYKKYEPKLLGKPKISVPIIVLHGVNDKVSLLKSSENQERHFTGFCEFRASFARGRAASYEKHRCAVRDAHAKSHGILKGEVQICDDLPEELKQGLFKEAKTYPVVIRYSTSPGDILPDGVAALGGMAKRFCRRSANRKDCGDA